ncbi:MAG: hypothetical protein ACLP2J_12650, partial [Acidimicrobiales bacterium]
MATAQDRQLRLLINKANGNFVTFRFRHTVESLMTEREMPLSLCLVSNVWEITLLIKKPDPNNRDAQITCCLKLVPG